MKWFLNISWLVTCLFILMLSSSTQLKASSIDCMKAQSASYNSLCSAYSYDSITVYFKDDAGVEQEVYVHRVKSRQTGELLHAEYDFIVDCQNQFNCSNETIMAQQVMFSFAKALHHDALYQLEPASCDPALELCCDILGTCTQVQDSGNTEKQNAKSLTTTDEIQTTTRSGRITKTERAIQTSDAAVSLTKNLYQHHSNPTTFSDAFINQINAEPKFMFVTTSSPHTFKMCKMTNGICMMIEGTLYTGINSFSAAFQHSAGEGDNMIMYQLLSRFATNGEYKSCSSSFSCHERSCETLYSCQSR